MSTDGSAIVLAGPQEKAGDREAVMTAKMCIYMHQTENNNWL